MNSKNLTKKIIIPSVIVCLLITGTGIFTTLNYNFKNNQQQSNEKNEFVSLKLLNVLTNEDGSITKTFEYFIKPDNASDHSVQATAKYKDNTSCDDVVVISTSTKDHTISVTVKKDFSKQILLTVTSVSTPSISAQVTIDYEKKLISLEDLKSTIQIGGLTQSPGEPDYYLTTWNQESELNSLFMANYSKYTIDKNYTYQVSYNSATYDELFVNNSYEDMWLDSLGNYLLDILKNKTQPSETEIWNLFDSNQYHSWLVNSSSEGASIGFDIEYSVICNENSSKSISNTAYIYLGMDYNYTNFNVLVDQITFDDYSLIF